VWETTKANEARWSHRIEARKLIIDAAIKPKLPGEKTIGSESVFDAVNDRRGLASTNRVSGSRRSFLDPKRGLELAALD
jgi:hypothetical protein